LRNWRELKDRWNLELERMSQEVEEMTDGLLGKMG